VKDSSHQECWDLARVNNGWNFYGAYWDIGLVDSSVVPRPRMEDRMVLGIGNLYKGVEHRFRDY